MALNERLLKEVNANLKRLLEEKEQELLSEKEAAKFLGVALQTLWNRHSMGRIPASCYKVNVLGKRMYLKSKLVSDE